MRTTRQKLMTAAVLSIAVVAARSALAYYNPSAGRFLSRDPLGEPGFQALQGAQETSLVGPVPVAQPPTRWINRDSQGCGLAPLTAGQEPTRGDLFEDEEQDQPSESNLYAFVGNDAVRNVDSLGLLIFEGCSPQTQATAEAAFTSYCAKVKSSAFKCCVGHFNIPQRLTSMCDHPDDKLHPIRIKCQAANKGFCKGACAYSFPGGSTIHLCGDPFNNPGCIEPGCILLHEMTHMIGHGFEKWPVRVQNCLGCSRPY